MFDVVVLHELSNFLTSKLRSVVGYQLIWNSIPGDLTLHEITFLADRLSSLEISGHFEK